MKQLANLAGIALLAGLILAPNCWNWFAPQAPGETRPPAVVGPEEARRAVVGAPGRGSWNTPANYGVTESTTANAAARRGSP